jgi:signal transduction histidine kinase
MVLYSILFFYLPTIVVGIVYVNLFRITEMRSNSELIESQRARVESLLVDSHMEYFALSRYLGNDTEINDLLGDRKFNDVSLLLEKYKVNYRLENLFIFDSSCIIVASPLTEQDEKYPLQCPVSSATTVTYLPGSIALDTIITLEQQTDTTYYLFTRYIIPAAVISRVVDPGFIISIVDTSDGRRVFHSDLAAPETPGADVNRITTFDTVSGTINGMQYRLNYYELQKLPGSAEVLLEIAVPRSRYQFRLDALGRFTLFILLIWILSTVLFFLLQNRQLVVPMEKLLNRAESIANGEYSGLVTVKSNDELGRLADRFNTMAESLQKKENMLKLVNEKLEKIVIQRTKTLKLTLDKLRDYDNIKTDLFYSIVHDLKNPLTVISGYANMIMDYDHFTREKKEDFLHKISDESERMIEMLNDFLTTLREEHNLGRMDFSSIDITSVLQYFFNIYEIQARENNIDLNWSVASTLPNVFGNKDKLEHVISNLLSNAFKYTESGGAIGITARVEGKYVLCGVADTGPGIEEGMERAVFEKFKKSQSSKKGTGLGLYIAQQIIINHNGRIWVENKDGGGGCTFYFTVPIYTA